MPDAPRLLALLGSVTPPGRMHRALEDAVSRANAADGDWTFLDLGTLQLGFADGTPIDQLEDDTSDLVDQVRDADGVVLASPVYRASLTGALKNALDLLPVDALQGKPVGILAMGGSHHHYLGVATHLRDVLQWFGALPAPTDVDLTSADFSEGIPTDTAAAEVDALLATVGTLASRLADAELGRFLDAVERLRPRSEQLVALTSDHGEELFDHGGVLHGYTLYDEMIRIPLVLWSPGRVPPGEAWELESAGPGPTDPLDLHATLSALVSEDSPPDAGRSLWPWLAEPSTGTVRRMEPGMIPEVHFAAAASVKGGIFSAQTPRWKLVYAPRTGPRWGQGSRLGRDYSPAYLFDLQENPGETRNRIGEGGLEAAWLRARLRAWVETHRANDATEEPRLDPEVSRRLRALGYTGS